MMRYGFAVFMLLVSSVVHADGLPVLRVSDQSGFPGLRHAQRAVEAERHGFSVSYGFDITQLSGVVVPGDSVDRRIQTLGITYALHPRFIVGVQQRMVFLDSSSSTPKSNILVGDPSFEARFNVPLLSSLFVGASTRLTLPTQTDGTSLAASSPRFDALGTLTYRPLSWLETTMTLGYRLDRTLGSAPNDVDTGLRFGLGLNRSHQILYAVGLMGIWNTNPYVGLAPFVELSGALGPEGDLNQKPILASVGLNTLLLPSRRLEIGVGSDVGIQGKPSDNNPWSGVPAWDVFLRLTVHLTASPSKSGSSNKVVTEEKIREVVRAPARFKIQGTVLHASTKQPVPQTVVDVVSENVRLTVDEKTGQFTTWPMDVGDGLLKLRATAPGYRPAEITIPRGIQEGDVKTASFAMQPLTGPAIGTLKGNVKHAASGVPVRATLFLPSLDKKIEADENGVFQGDIPAGTHTVLISGPGYITQKKDIQVRHGDIIIINVDLAPKP